MAAIADLSTVAASLTDVAGRAVTALEQATSGATHLSPDDQATLDSAVSSVQGAVDQLNAVVPAAPAAPADGGVPTA